MLKFELLLCLITINALASPTVAAAQIAGVSTDATESADKYELQLVSLNVYRAPKGTTFRVVLSTPITSETATFGDSVNAVLDTDIYAGDKLAIARGSLLTGTVTLVDRARNKLKSKFADYRWLNSGAGIAFQFNTLKVGQDQTLAINAQPAPDSTIDRAEPKAAPLVVDRNGEVMPKSTGKLDRTTSVAVTAASVVGTPLTGIVLSGVAGAAHPTYALGYGGALQSDHARVKGFFVGAAQGVPGMAIARQVFGKGDNLVLDTGDGVTITLLEPLTIKTNVR